MKPAPPPPAWQRAFDAYEAELAAFVRDRVPVGEEEDLLQEVWAALATGLEDAEITNPRAWLYRVARNRIADLYRSRATRPAFLDVTPETDLPADGTAYLPEVDLRSAIEAALDQLPDLQREVFVRNEIDGETLREIALDLGIPLKTAISRKGYARQRLRDILRGAYEEYFGYGVE